jgi:hypothetical protein
VGYWRGYIYPDFDSEDVSEYKLLMLCFYNGLIFICGWNDWELGLIWIEGFNNLCFEGATHDWVSFEEFIWFIFCFASNCGF